MERSPGRRDEPSGSSSSAAAGKDGPAAESSGGLGFLYGLGRFVGFMLLAGPALAIIAGIVLLPAYKSMKTTQYERDCRRSANAQYKEYLDAVNRQIAEAPEDEQFTLRLRMEQGRLMPPGEVAIEVPNDPGEHPPGTIYAAPSTKPAPPSGLLLTMADRVADPATRRGLLLLAAVAMLAALFLFAPPEKYQPAAGSAGAKA